MQTVQITRVNTKWDIDKWIIWEKVSTGDTTILKTAVAFDR